MMPVRRATGDRAGCGTVPMRAETSQQERTHPVVTKWYETRRGAPECRPLWVRTSARRVAGSGRDTYITNRTQRIDSPRAPKSPANGYDRELPMRPTRNGDCKRRPGRATGIAPDGWSDTKGDRSLSPPNTRLPVGSQDRAWSVAGDLGLDLESGRRILPLGHPDRGSLPREGTPQRGGEGPLRGAERPRGRLGADPPRGARRRAPLPARGRLGKAVPRAPRPHEAGGGPEGHRLSLGESPPHALPGLSRPRAVHLHGGCRGRLQGGHWDPAQTRRHALERPGGNAIIALRCCTLSGRFEDFWERRAERQVAS